MADGWIDETPAGGWPWEGLAPGPGLAVAVGSADPDALSGEARVSLLKACDLLAGWVAVRSGRAMVAVSEAVLEATREAPAVRSSGQDAWVGEELAAALRVAPSTALIKASAADDLVRVWPALGEAVERGRVTWAQACVVAQGVRVLQGHVDAAGRDLAQVAVSWLLPDAGRYPPARLRERVAAQVIRLHPQAAAERRRTETRDRTGVDLWPEPDGMACLAVRGAVPDLLALRSRIHAAADRLRAIETTTPETTTSATTPDTTTWATTPDTTTSATTPETTATARTVGQWRVAALLGAFGVDPVGMPLAPSAPRPDVAGAGGVASSSCGGGCRRPQVRVVIDLATLFGLSSAPGELEGYGPIDPDLARALAADADWVRWVTDPVTGHLLDAGSRRLPTPAQVRHVTARDARCSHPACGRRSAHCDVDHVPEYRDTHRTRVDALAPACAKHNRGRDAAGWTAAPHPAHDPTGGPAPVWTSPLGQRYYALTAPPLPASPAPRRAPPDDEHDAPPDDDPPPF